MTENLIEHGNSLEFTVSEFSEKLKNDFLSSKYGFNSKEISKIEENLIQYVRFWEKVIVENKLPNTKPYNFWLKFFILQQCIVPSDFADDMPKK